LLTHSVNLDDVFLSADQGRSGTYGLLLLKNASATGEQYSHRQAKNHVFHSGYIQGINEAKQYQDESKGYN
jgi:hypothetical protein